MKPVIIGNRPVGSGQPLYIVAEAGVNHNGDLDRAKLLVDASVAAGADAVKFQTFTSTKVCSADAATAEYQRKTSTDTTTQRRMLETLELPASAFRELASYCRTCGITFLSTPFDLDSAELLNTLNVPAFKIGSGDLTNIPLLRHIADYNRPMILSTGMATLEEVKKAVEHLRVARCLDIIVLHCTSTYPADPSEANLRAIDTLKNALRVPVGFSDHTLGSDVAIAAVAIGACIIEKHVTLDKRLPGPDHQASMDQNEFRSFCRSLRIIETAMGTGIKCPTAAESEVARIVRRSIHTQCSLAKGHCLTAGDITALRPGTGISAAHWDRLIGRKLARAVAAGAMLSEEDFECEDAWRS